MEKKELETKEDGRMVNLNLLNEDDEDNNNVKANLKKDPSAKKKAEKLPKKKKKQSPKKKKKKSPTKK